MKRIMIFICIIALSPILVLSLLNIKRPNINLSADSKNLNIDEETINELFNIYKEDTCIKKTILRELNKANSARLFLAYSLIDESEYKTIGCDSVSDSIIYDEGKISHYCGKNTGFEITDWNIAEIIGRNTSYSIDGDLIKENYEKLFGDDSFHHEDFSVGMGPIMHYDKDTNKYIYFGCECGGSCSLGNVILKNATLNNGILKLEVMEDNSKLDDVASNLITYNFMENDKNFIFINKTIEKIK